jgi:hypothetical protein
MPSRPYEARELTVTLPGRFAVTAGGVPVPGGQLESPPRGGARQGACPGAGPVPAPADPRVSRPLGCASDGTQNIHFGVARVGRLGDQVADQNGGSSASSASKARNGAL